MQTFDKRSALAFIVAFGVVSLFADMAYEGMRSSTGPFLAALGATGAAVGIIAGTGELFGYLLRLASGRLAQRTHAYWPIAIAGYAIQMAAVPLLAFAGNWMLAAVLIVVERAGKALRSPAANTMQSKAGDQIGQGWAFGLHEAMDQTGALAGPLIAALVLARHGDYRDAFLWLGVPAVLTILTVIAVAWRFPYAQNIAVAASGESGAKLPPAFWLYAAASVLIGFGFADYPLIAYHFAKAATVSPVLIPVFYAVAMGASGAGSLLFGRWFDRRGLFVLFPGIAIGIVVTPFVFFGGFWFALAGTLLWGVSLGVHDAIMNAAVARMVPEQTRARAYGIFSAIFGIAWFAGSAVMGLLYDVSLLSLVVAAVVAELAAFIPLTLAIRAAK
ncbi:MAG TPA: MFS transporter [Rhizomicrobium sp.]|jgi:predicted MFS family arabinose efflux permease|nr:MFS transporter [Rhizomicrobium sp.]